MRSEGSGWLPDQAPRPPRGRRKRTIVKATIAGQCTACGKTMRPGTPISKLNTGWAHTSCCPKPKNKPSALSQATADFNRNRALVLSGETYRGRR